MIGKSTLVELYQNQSLSDERISRKLGCSRDKVRYWLNRHQIPMRGNYKRYNLSKSKELAYALGVLEGDGYVSNDRIGLLTTSKEVAQSFWKVLSSMGLDPWKLLRAKAKTTANKQIWKVGKTSRYLSEWYKNLTYDQKLALVSGYERDFLRGVYESDGSNSGRVEIGNSNINIIKMVEYCLNKLNFKFSRYIGKTSLGKVFYRVYVCGGKMGWTRFLAEINPCIRRKVEKEYRWGKLKKSKIPQEKEEGRMRLYKLGLNDREISRRTGLSKGYIANWRKIRGLFPNAKYNKTHYQQVLNLREDGLSIRKIAKRTNIPKTTVGNWVSGKIRPAMVNTMVREGLI